LYPHFRQGGPHVVELERLDDGYDHFHGTETPLDETLDDSRLHTFAMQHDGFFLMYNARHPPADPFLKKYGAGPS
jgi:hypothetical protein